MRVCPVCEQPERTRLFSQSFHIPDDWTVPSEIVWYTCDHCNMIYGDGGFTQADLDIYYRERYGYGVNSPSNEERIRGVAAWISENYDPIDTIVDFGGGESVLRRELEGMGFCHVYCVEPGDELPDNCRVIFASHVLEHIYDLPGVMRRLVGVLHLDGVLFVDGPDATGLLNKWKMPMLDFNTKHIQHFRLIDYLRLGEHYGLELTDINTYEDMRPSYAAPAYQLHFKRLDVAYESAWHVQSNIGRMLARLREIREPVNIWGLGDITWHLLSYDLPDLQVLDFIDNDPAYRGQTYKGKPVLERPTNDAPILIVSQGQRLKLIENIRKAGITNDIIEI